MDQIKNLNKKAELLKQQEQAYQLTKKTAREEIYANYKEFAELYQNFWNQKNNTDFVLYNQYPSMEAFLAYVKHVSNQFILYPYGKLDAKELAEVIKYLFQYHTGQEYFIYTIGAVEKIAPRDYFPAFSEPHLYFVIGNQKNLAPFEPYNGCLVNRNQFFSKLYLAGMGRDFISLELDGDCKDKNSMGIECLTGSACDKEGFINYYDSYSKTHRYIGASLQKQLFTKLLSKYKMDGIHEVFDFKIHRFDTYIAKVLISIILYKRNNHLDALSKDDYHFIFTALFGEVPDIQQDVLNDFPKKLVYVPADNEK